MKYKIKEMLNNPKVDFNTFYQYLQDENKGNWDDINSEETIKQYINEMIEKGISVSHILEAMETNPSSEGLFNIWLGNSMETPTPINNKKDLLEALGLKVE